MSNEHKPLSERVRGCAYIVPDPHPTDTDASEREVLGLNRVADEIATLEKRLAGAESWRGQIDAFVRRIMGEVNCGKACGGLDWDQNNPQSTTQVVLDGIKAHTQAAIDAALESVADLLDSGDDWNTGDEIAEFIRSRIGTNPLAERAAEYARGIEFRAGQLAGRDRRIAELERELSTKDDTIVDGMMKRNELKRERDRAIQHHERCAEKLFKAERELAEARKDRRRLAAMMPLFQEARDAICYISLTTAKLRGLDLTLADRVDTVGIKEKWEEYDAAMLAEREKG